MDAKPQPTAMLFSRYRAFRDEWRVPIAPLTIIIGRNGSGKSVITRLPLLLISGLSLDADAPIDLTAGGISHASRFEDLIHQRSAQQFMLGAEIKFEDSILCFKTTLIHIVERYELSIVRFELFKDNKRVIDLMSASPEDIAAQKGKFVIGDARNNDNNREQYEIPFVGLMPSVLPNTFKDIIDIREIREFFISAFSPCAYLGPFRNRLDASGHVPRQGVKSLGSRGEFALDVLGDDAVRGDGMLGQLVGAWFQDAMGGNRVFLQSSGGIPRLMVRDATRSLDVDIAETGAGFAQILPLAVKVLANRLGRLTSPLTIVEQPELHLHPGAHGAIADLITRDIAQTNARTAYLCETHSEQFVTRVRRRVAEGELNASDVRILSVGHQSESHGEIEALRTITVDTYGNTDSWPVGVFDEALDDLIALKEAATIKSS